MKKLLRSLMAKLFQNNESPKVQAVAPSAPTEEPAQTPVLVVKPAAPPAVSMQMQRRFGGNSHDRRIKDRRQGRRSRRLVAA